MIFIVAYYVELMKLQQVLYLGPEDHKYYYHIAKPKEQTSETLSNIKEFVVLDIEPHT